MKKMLFAIFVSIIICGCGINLSCTSTTNSTQMANAYEQTFSNEQFDSICTADTISSNLDNWNRTTLINGDDGNAFSEYLYITHNGNVVYRLLKVSADSVKLTKRVVK